MNKEIWKDIKGYEGCYQCSNLGNIKSLDRKVKGIDNKVQTRKGKMIKPYLCKNGYCIVYLYKNNKQTDKYVHRIIAETFLENNDKERTTVNHIDGNKTNNNVNNLEWTSYSENLLHSYRKLHRQPPKGKNQGKWVKIKVVDVENNTETSFASIKEASRQIKLSQTQIRRYLDNEVANKLWKGRYLIQAV